MMNSSGVHGVQLDYSYHQNVHLTWLDSVGEETHAQMCSLVLFFKSVFIFKKLEKQKRLHPSLRAAGLPSLIVVLLGFSFRKIYPIENDYHFHYFYYLRRNTHHLNGRMGNVPSRPRCSYSPYPLFLVLSN